jgi:hypothetical protein
MFSSTVSLQNVYSYFIFHVEVLKLNQSCCNFKEVGYFSSKLMNFSLLKMKFDKIVIFGMMGVHSENVHADMFRTCAWGHVQEMPLRTCSAYVLEDMFSTCLEDMFRTSECFCTYVQNWFTSAAFPLQLDQNVFLTEEYLQCNVENMASWTCPWGYIQDVFIILNSFCRLIHDFLPSAFLLQFDQNALFKWRAFSITSKCLFPAVLSL